MVLLAVAGLVAGVLGGMLGLGGSVIMIPAMFWVLGPTLEGYPQIHQYQAAAMIVNFLLVVPSVVPHVKAHAIWKKVWLHMSAAAMVGMGIGVWLSFRFGGQHAIYLQWIVGGFFLYVVAQNVQRLLMARSRDGLPREEVEALPAWRRLLVGFPVGLSGGLLGIGGGALAVPGQQMILKMPLRNAIATSAATIASISWLGAIMKNAALHGHGTVARSALLAGLLAPMAMVGSYLGAYLTHRLPLKTVRLAFVVLMLLGALKMFGLM
jgi:hypothetical protein